MPDRRSWSARRRALPARSTACEWNGREFINTYDHGRQLQSASTFGSQECFNPTEAGSKDDDRGNTSTSQLLSAKVTGHQFITHSRMAFWLAPGQTSTSCPGQIGAQ